MKHANIVSIIIISIGIITATIITINLDHSERSFVSIVSIVGSVASFFGLIVAIIQISSIKATSELTSKAVQETKAKLVDKLSIADVSKATKLAREIQAYVRDNKTESAYLRLTDLKSSLLQFQSSLSFRDSREVARYARLVNQIHIDILNLFDFLSGMQKEIDFSAVNNNLEQLITVLSQLENTLKFRI